MDFLEIGGISLFVAFAAGLLSCLSPCVLPLIPAYLGYLTGASLETADVPVQSSVVRQAVPAGGSPGGTIALSAPAAMATPSPFLHSLSFVSGFSPGVRVFGASPGPVRSFMRDQQDLILKVSGGLLIVMGLLLSSVITIPFLEQERRLDVGGGARGGYARSFFVGSAFSAGWSPCIGPTLGAILALAVSSGTVLEAGILLLAYSVGLGAPSPS